ncbi:unnamed protein product, partial [Closterium sp. NIES-53]
IFREPLQLNFDATAEDIETALLTPDPSPLLKDIHITLLKGIQPFNRPPADHRTWATLVCRRVHNTWPQVGPGICPLYSCQG